MKLKKGVSFNVGRKTYTGEVPDKVLDAAKIDEKARAKMRAPKEKKPTDTDTDTDTDADGKGKGKGKDGQ